MTDTAAPVTGAIRTGADLPTPPADAVEAARAVPDHWITVVDPGWAGTDAPPRWALVGAWRTDGHGEIVEWRDNDEHRPSPVALGWPEPTDQLDRLAQRVVTGYAPAEVLIGVLADSDVIVLVAPDGAPVATTSVDGTPVIVVYSSRAQADTAGAVAQRVLPVARVVASAPPGHQLLLNPAGSAVLALDIEAVRARLADR